MKWVIWQAPTVLKRSVHCTEMVEKERSFLDDGDNDDKKESRKDFLDVAGDLLSHFEDSHNEETVMNGCP